MMRPTLKEEEPPPPPPPPPPTSLGAAYGPAFDEVLTLILKQKLNDRIRLKWAEFRSAHESVPPCTELLKFLDLHARQHESVTQVGHKHASGSDRNMPSVKPSYATYTDDACLACKKRGHKIHTCTVFNGWIWADKISVVKKLRLCMTCMLESRTHCREMSSTINVQELHKAPSYLVA